MYSITIYIYGNSLNNILKECIRFINNMNTYIHTYIHTYIRRTKYDKKVEEHFVNLPISINLRNLP